MNFLLFLTILSFRLESSETRRVGMIKSLKLTSEQQDAIEYFEGKNFHNSYQNPKI